MGLLRQLQESKMKLLLTSLDLLWSHWVKILQNNLNWIVNNHIWFIALTLHVSIFSNWKATDLQETKSIIGFGHLEMNRIRSPQTFVTAEPGLIDAAQGDLPIELIFMYPFRDCCAWDMGVSFDSGRLQFPHSVVIGLLPWQILCKSPHSEVYQFGGGWYFYGEPSRNAM